MFVNTFLGVFSFPLYMRIQAILGILLFWSISALAQKTGEGLIRGKVLDPYGSPLEFVNITVRDLPQGARTNAEGEFVLSLPAKRNVQLTFSYLGYEPLKMTRFIEEGKIINITVSLKSVAIKIKEFTVRDETKRTEAGSIRIDPKKHNLLPSTVGGIEGLLKIFLSNNNELTSQYNVRGGNFDENLVYINDFEVYRPFLVRSGQQEGLSIINPDLVSGVNFSTGGFQAKYGDKMSSVLDITYKKPKEFAGSLTLSLLGFGAHLEGVGLNRRLSYMVGLRQKSNQYLLQAQQTKGVYNPTFTDVQGYLTYQFNTDWQLDVFTNFARNRFDFIPENSTQSFGLINKAFQLQTFYTGAETDQFDSRFSGISLTHRPNDKLQLKWLASGFMTNESETYDIQGEYLLGEIETDLSKANFGDLKYALGTGVIHTFARNYLNILVGNVGHKGTYKAGRHFLQWGAQAEHVDIRDKLNEWERRDSAGFSQPYSDTVLLMARRYKSAQDFVYSRFNAYLQDNLAFDSIGLVMTGGLRINYNQLNQELLVSPRLQMAYKPLSQKRDVVYRFATGLYSQPPFYREMRLLDGSVNLDLKAQRSYHAVGGLDYQFQGLGGRPFKFTTELYYKYMWNLVPYEYDNVRIRYLGKNNAVGYAYGAEFRLYGDLVKDAESWVSLGLMKTAENLLDDKIVFPGVGGGDSAVIYPGFIPRPTDSRVSFGLFFSDYLPRNKNFKLYLNGLYSTGLPFGPPDQNRYGDTLRIPSYKRVDIGFAALIIDGAKKDRPSYSYFQKVKTMWLSLEVFNLLGIQNTLSYMWIQDQSTSRTYAVPNRLTARLLNIKLVTQF